jgi:hypothetical protein
VLLSQSSAIAQTVNPPKAEEVGNSVKDRRQYQGVLLGVDTLRLVLLLLLWQLRGPSEDRNRDLAQWLAV